MRKLLYIAIVLLATFTLVDGVILRWVFHIYG